MKKAEKIRQQIVQRLDKSLRRLTQSHNALVKAQLIGKNSTWSDKWDSTDAIEVDIYKVRKGLEELKAKFPPPVETPVKAPEVLLG